MERASTEVDLEGKGICPVLIQITIKISFTVAGIAATVALGGI